MIYLTQYKMHFLVFLVSMWLITPFSRILTGSECNFSKYK
uniref:Uncharacterized protein n=1 Tax=Rhizophora mucronata TaxID=61149 RepID=A0A2P2PSL4_RHIMU